VRRSSASQKGASWQHAFVHAHSIIALEAEGALENGRDGVVKYVNAHIDGVESERVIRSPHSC